MAATPQVQVGVAAVICNDQGQLVIGRRKGGHGAGTLAFPGGHLEFGETHVQCAEREALEETGLRVKAVKLLAVTDDFFTESSRQYLTIFVTCKREDPKQEPENVEPEKCEGWAWMSWAEIEALAVGPGGEERLFPPIVTLMKQNIELDHSFSG